MAGQNARARSFSVNIVRLVELFDDDWFESMENEAKELKSLIRDVRQKLRKKIKKAVADKESE